MPTEIIVIAIVICGNDLAAATSHSALSALRGRDAGQQGEQGQSAVGHLCLPQVRNDGHFHAAAQRLKARPVRRPGRRAILLPTHT